MTTPKQQLQQARSWFKYRLLGAYTPINIKFLTKEEYITYKE